MKKCLFLLMFVGYGVMGQAVIINNTTQNTACQAGTIIVNFSTSGVFADNTFTVELIKKDVRYAQYGAGGSNCNGTTTSISSTTTTTMNTVSLILPNESSLINSSVLCGSQYIPGVGYFNVYANVNVSFSIRVSNGTVQSSEYPITIVSTANCTNILSAQPQFQNICDGANGLVNFYTQNMANTNVFTIELSDQYGSFPTTPTVIGTLSNNNTNGLKSQNITIPSGLTYSSSYKVKVKSTNPIDEKISNNFTIGIEKSTIYASSKYCVESDILLSYNSFRDSTTTSFIWKKEGNIIPNASTSVKSFLKKNSIISDAGNYTVTATRISDGCASTSVPFLITALVPPTITATPNLAIYGQLTTLSSTGCAGTVKWYSRDTAPNNQFFSELSTVGVGLRENNIYYASCYDLSSQCYTAKSSLSVSVANPSNAPATPIITESVNNICGSNSIILTASGCSGTVIWYDSYYGHDYVITGSNTSSPYTHTINIANRVIGQSSQYSFDGMIYAECRVNDVISQRGSKQISYKYTVPPYLNNFTVNNGSDATISVNNCVGGVVKWYDTASGGSLIFTGKSYIKANNTTNFTIHSSCTINSCESTRSSVTVFVTTLPVSTPIAPFVLFDQNFSSIYQNSYNICEGGVKTLNSTGCTNGTINWYNEAGTLLGTGQSFITPPIILGSTTSITTIIYKFDCTIGGFTSPKGTFTFSVKQPPPKPTITANKYTVERGASNITLAASGCPGIYYAPYSWYNATNPNNSILEDNKYLTLNGIRSDVTYSVSCYNEVCTSEKTSITILVGDVQTPPPACTLQETTKSGNWNDPTLWSCGTIPDKTQDVKINTGHVIILNNAMGIQKCKDMSIETGGLLYNTGSLSMKEN